ncbi:MAG: glycosyltransferase [Pelotomaculum sp.]|nr:glycosyltransferase [Pelotomaculum sp.]
MKVLVLSDTAPGQADQGDRIRLSHFIGWLSRRHEVTLLHFAGDRKDAPGRLAVPPPTATGKIIRSLLAPHLPVTVASRRTERMKMALAGLTRREKYDITFIYQAKMASYLSFLNGPAVVDLTDALSLYYGRLREFCRWPLQQFYRLEQWKMRRFERRLMKRGIFCMVASELDARYLQGLVPEARIAVVPNGVDTDFYIPVQENDGNFDLVFVGNMSYLPNRDGVLYFYREVFPLVLNGCPEARLVIVGKNPPADILLLRENPAVSVTGYVADVRPYLAAAGVVICPIRFGAGTRIKILEAMAMGKAVVSTALGCEGLEITAGYDIEVADEPAAMAAKIIKLLKNPEKRKSLGKKARETVLKKYDWENICLCLERLLVEEAEKYIYLFKLNS